MPMADLNTTIDRVGEISRQVGTLLDRRLKAAQGRYTKRMQKAATQLAARRPRNPVQAWQDAIRYSIDSSQRTLLFWDTLRQRGNQWIEHERAGKPILLHYDSEMLADARTFERPCNHALLRIVPPNDVTVDDRLRPFIIIDPRAGHGPGIGGFKKDSEVGVALSAGHPVYFVVFYPDPVPGQTLADVVDAEAEFVRIVAQRHPQSDKPVLVGNCQGGWAVMMLAASRPDIAGPCVVNGAPMSYWAGNDGDNPMRYAGGLAGGAWLSLFASDLGGGKFDGAHLVQNFENLNPANTFWKKYYDVWANIDTEPERFLEFERWWGGYYLFNDQEIRWIVNNLFVGNKLSQGDARLGPGRFFDLKSIKSPIIVFASMGDNITPPQQAFNWIGDLYSSTEEIKANGQTIVGLLHEDIGHLGIFVSGQVALREHAQIVELLREIQQLPPGLYGMDIKENHGRDGTVEYEVTLVERTLEDLRKLQKYDRVDERPFEAVAALSELTERAYELLGRPIVRQMTPEWLAKTIRAFHPLRVQRWAISDHNPAFAGACAAGLARAGEPPAAQRRQRARPARALLVGRDRRLARSLPRPARRLCRGAVLPCLRQPAIVERRRPAARDPARYALRSAHRAGSEAGAGHDRGRRRDRRLRADRPADREGGQRQAQAVVDAGRSRADRAGAPARRDFRGRIPPADARGDDRRRVRSRSGEARAAAAHHQRRRSAPRARTARRHPHAFQARGPSAPRARRDPHAAAGSGESEWRAGAAAEARGWQAGGEAHAAPYERKALPT